MGVKLCNCSCNERADSEGNLQLRKQSSVQIGRKATLLKMQNDSFEVKGHSRTATKEMHHKRYIHGSRDEHTDESAGLNEPPEFPKKVRLLDLREENEMSAIVLDGLNGEEALSANGNLFSTKGAGNLSQLKQLNTSRFGLNQTIYAVEESQAKWKMKGNCFDLPSSRFNISLSLPLKRGYSVQSHVLEVR